MSLMWVIYFAGVSDGIRSLLTFAAVTLFVTNICATVFAFSAVHDELKKAKSIVAVTIVSWVVCLLASICSVSIPDKTTIYLMAGTRVAEDIVKSPEVKDINGKILTIINQKLDSIIEPTSKE